jgi:hypothetical protein
MPRRKNIDSPDSDFTRHSDGESTCMFCFLTVHSGTPESLDLVENIHRGLCPANPRAPVFRRP